MSRRSDSSRGNDGSKRKKEYEVFEPARGVKAYTPDNLRRFVASAGESYLKEYDLGLADIQKKAFAEGEAAKEAELGRLLNDTEKKAVHRKIGISGAYRKRLNDFRWDYIMSLYDEGLELTAKPKLEREISIDKVGEIWASEGEEGLKSWFLDQDATSFKTNALNEVAKKLNVAGRTTIKSSEGARIIGNDKKVALYELIKADITGQAPAPKRVRGRFKGDKVAVPAVVTVDPKVKKVLADAGITSVEDLRVLTSVQLKDLLGKANLSKTGNKPDLIDRLAAYGGLTRLRARADVAEQISAIMERATTDPESALMELRSISQEELDLLEVNELRRLAGQLDLRDEKGKSLKTGTKTAIIFALTGKQVARSRSAEKREQILVSRNACMGASKLEVDRIAKTLGITVTPGMTQGQICSAIFATHLKQVSVGFLKEAPGAIEKILKLSADKQGPAFRALSKRLGLPETSTLGGLMREWLRAHYTARATTIYPGSEAIVEKFYTTGTVPTSAASLNALAMVFSELNNKLVGMTNEEKRQALKDIYERFIRVIYEDGAEAKALLEERLPQFSFEVKYPELSAQSTESLLSSPRASQQARLSEEQIVQETKEEFAQSGSLRGAATAAQARISKMLEQEATAAQQAPERPSSRRSRRSRTEGEELAGELV